MRAASGLRSRRPAMARSGVTLGCPVGVGLVPPVTGNTWTPATCVGIAVTVAVGVTATGATAVGGAGLVAVGVAVTARVTVAVEVGVAVRVTVGVEVGVAVRVTVGVEVGVAVRVTVGVEVGVAVRVTVGVEVGVAVRSVLAASIAVSGARCPASCPGGPAPAPARCWAAGPGVRCTAAVGPMAADAPNSKSTSSARARYLCLVCMSSFVARQAKGACLRSLYLGTKTAGDVPASPWGRALHCGGLSLVFPARTVPVVLASLARSRTPAGLRGRHPFSLLRA
jgi:hypothetical protein